MADEMAPGQPDLRNLQDKFHSLLDQRNQFNDAARAAREQRDLLNAQRREKGGEIDVHKKARDELNEKMKEHKELRNAYQDQAKALLAQRRGKVGAIEKSLPLQVRKLRNDIQALQERQETTVLTPAKEREVVESISEKRRELAKLEQELGKQKALVADVGDTDGTIDALFQKADEEHAKVVELQEQANQHHLKFVEAIKEVRTIGAESDQKHKEFIALKTKADEYHNKAMELREKVMAVRGERRAEYDARRQEMDSFNQQARRSVNDPRALERVKEDALDQLKKGGKITLGF